ncbi:cytochrome C oxidase subunit IV family protein [Pedobacter jeongneungensis]|uniref:cytochrome C oxidase subunit IV family protein n=1 Tax=Pedobacter jeongneungensis TaxID=947309 RepID=UPI0004681A1F|nr:cytochrome C oxidase subunit IV family protein [Pedobacter jeongneungensis]
MSEHSHLEEGHEHGEHAGMDKAKIWKVAGILTLITAIEFIIALWAIPGGHIPQHVGNYIYIALTLVKAFYIVAYFMHLKYEKLGLQLALTVSFIFIIYFIVLMLTEGGFLNIHMMNH